MINFVDQVVIHNQTVLLRVDFNVPLTKNGTVADDSRIQYALPTIKKLLENKNRLILVTHLGKPNGYDPTLSVRPIIDVLKTFLPSYTITLLADPNSITPPLSFADNEIKFLENIRFWPSEKENAPEFAKKMASLADIYVNDAFSVCHRSDASVTGIPSLLPSYGGLQLRKELTMIDRIIHSPNRPYVAILGGAKISTKLPLLEKLARICDSILVGGGMANTLLKAKGLEIGTSFYEEDQIEQAKAMLKQYSNKIVLPTDAITAAEPTGEPSVKAIENITDEEGIYDIGPDTQEHFSDIISHAKTILWNGPVGLFENSAYKIGTDAILTAISNNTTAYTVLGGGDTLNAIKDRKNILHNVHISTGGGAMLTYIADGSLPGITALENAS